MKKLLITAYSLELGGIEKALINFIRTMKDNYKITLVLEKKQGIFINEIPDDIEILEYKVANDKNVLIRKIKNFIKFNKFIKKYKEQFDIGISYATSSRPGSKLVRNLCKNNILFMHGDFSRAFDEDKKKIEKFFKSIKTYKFKKIVFVSNSSRKNQIEKFPRFFNTDCLVSNNFIDYREILKLSNEKINDEKLMNFINNKKEKSKVLVNISRHEEGQKRLTRIINSVEKLKQEGKEVKVVLVGDGPDSNFYKKMVNNHDLSEHIYFTGQKQNPYPYFKLADATILSSQFEGYPVVFVESMLLGIPIITTKVSDYVDIDGKYGICVERSEEGVYSGIKYFLENDIKTEKFNPEEFNAKIKTEMMKILEK